MQKFLAEITGTVWTEKSPYPFCGFNNGCRYVCQCISNSLAIRHSFFMFLSVKPKSACPDKSKFPNYYAELGLSVLKGSKKIKATV